MTVAPAQGDDLAPLPITFHACDLLTGAWLAELAVKPQGSLSATLMRAETAQFSIEVPELPPPGEWEVLTQPATTLIVAEVADTIVWGGIVWKREHKSQQVLLSTLTAESIFDRRYVPVDAATGTATYADDEQTAIVADMISRISDYNFVVSTPATEPSVPVQLVVSDQDNKRIADVLNQLAGYLNGAEWTVVIAWADSTKQAVTKTLVSSFRVGSSDPSQPAPTLTVFDETHMRDWDLVDADWSAGAGATSVTAFSNSGLDGSNAYSHDHRSSDLLAGGFPLLEERYSPGSAIGSTDDPTLDSISGLDGHAAGRAAEIGHGTTTFTCTLEAAVMPLPGRDWQLGDYVHISISDPRRWDSPREADQRVVSWSLDVADGFCGDLTPTFWEDTTSGTG